MGRQSKARKQEPKIGNGKVTMSQVAFIVDRYLYDNNYTDSRSVFRSEASSLLPNTTLHEVPRGLLTLGTMLDEYIQLKEQKMMMEQERARLEHETIRVQALLLGMQNVMDAYNSGATSCSMPLPPQPTATAVLLDENTNKKPSKSLAPSTSYPPRKRRNCKIIKDETQATKKPCNPLVSYESAGKDPSVVVSTPTDLANVQAICPQSSAPLQSSGNNHVCDGSVANKPSVANSLLFTESTQSPKSGSSDPRTPPQAASSPSEKSISPLDEATPKESRPTSCTTIVSSKTIFVSPSKQSSILPVERNHFAFSSPMKTSSEKQSIRCHVKGRLDFDGSDPSTSQNANKEGHSISQMNHDDIFDTDLPNLDSFGPNFSLSELLNDFNIGEMDYSFQSSLDSSTDFVLGLPCAPMADGSGIHQDFIQKSSSATEVLVGKGTDSFATMRSITKRVQFSSPAKTPRRSNDAEK